MFKDYDHTKQIYKLKINRKKEITFYFILYCDFFVFYDYLCPEKKWD